MSAEQPSPETLLHACFSDNKSPRIPGAFVRSLYQQNKTMLPSSSAPAPKPMAARIIGDGFIRFGDGAAFSPIEFPQPVDISVSERIRYSISKKSALPAMQEGLFGFFYASGFSSGAASAGSSGISTVFSMSMSASVTTGAAASFGSSGVSSPFMSFSKSAPSIFSCLIRY